MTFSGAVVGCTPMTAGARGRARCRKESVVTAMLGKCMVRSRGGGDRYVGAVENSPSSSIRLVVGFVGVFCAKIRNHV